MVLGFIPHLVKKMKRTIFKGFTPLVPVLFFILSCHAQQKSLPDELNNLFIEASFNRLDVSSGYAEFTGRALNRHQADLFYSFFSEQPYYPSYDIYAIYCFRFNDSCVAYLLRVIDEELAGACNISIYLFNRYTGKFTLKEVVAGYYGDEGSATETFGWLVDINEDHVMDIIHRERYYDVVQEDSVTETISLKIWTGHAFSGQSIGDDPLLLKLLKADFPYPPQQTLSDTTKAYLQKRLYASGIKVNVCTIVLGSDKDAESALTEVKRVKNLIHSNKLAYSIYLDSLEIYKKGNRYYTVVRVISNNEISEGALKELKEKINSTAYIVSFKDWCGNFHKKENYFECR
jgi:hypothetical protein